MRLGRRIKALERRAVAALGAGCPVCRSAGWPTVLVPGVPPEMRPACWPAGCRACGRTALEHSTWIRLGPDAGPEQARTFMEAV